MEFVAPADGYWTYYKAKLELCPFRVRLISLASQKFVSDVVNDAMQHCKMKGSAPNKKQQGKVTKSL